MKLFFDKQTDFGKSITEFENIDVIIGLGNNDNIGLEDLPTDIWINFIINNDSKWVINYTIDRDIEKLNKVKKRYDYIINQLLTRDVIKESELEINGVESFIDFYMDI